MSLMNGLSAAGAAISTYAGAMGLEAQKADLAQQGIKLADQLATTRELNVMQPFQAAQTLVTEAGANTRSAANNAAGIQESTLSANATTGAAVINAQANKDVENIRANATPESIKTLQWLGVLPFGASPPGGAARPTGATTGNATGGGGAAPATGANATGTPTGAATPDQSAAAPTGTPEPSPPKAGGASTTTEDVRTAVINKTLGLPALGSEAAGRMAVANDVNNDPNFKYATAGVRAAETETRWAVATGKMTDPNQRAALATAIAGYQLSPISGRAAMMPGGAETMKLVLAINPDYQATRFNAVNKAMTDFGSGPQGDTIRANDVAVQHLDVIDKAATALANHDTRGLNALGNQWNAYFGSAPPTTFDGLKQVVATEVGKAVSGGIGSDADREALRTSMSGVNSPEQLQGMTNGFRSLMVGQINGLKTQYEAATGFKSGPFAFETKLSPTAQRVLGLQAGGEQGTQSPPPSAAAAPPAPGKQNAPPTWTDRTKAPPVGATLYNDQGAGATWNGSTWQPVR